MNPSYYRISLDIQDATSQLSFPIKKGDTNRRLLISLTDNGVPYTLTKDCYAIFSATKPDKTTLFNDCTIKNNIIEYDFTPQTTSVEGRLDCEIILIGNNNTQLACPRFTVLVYATNFSEEEIESSSEYKSLLTLVSEGNAYLNDVKETLAEVGVPLVAKQTLYYNDFEYSDASHTDIHVRYFNRKPIVGEQFVAIVQGGDDTPYAVNYRVHEVDEEIADCYIVYSVKLGGDEESLGGAMPLIVNKTIDFKDLLVKAGNTYSIELDYFNRTPNEGDVFSSHATDIIGNWYYVVFNVISVLESGAKVRLGSLKKLHDEKRISALEEGKAADAVNKSGDTMTGDLTVGDGDQKTIVSNDHIGVYEYVGLGDLDSSTELRIDGIYEVLNGLLHQSRHIFFPAVRYGEGAPPTILDETLATEYYVEHYVDEMYSAINTSTGESFPTYQDMVAALLEDAEGKKYKVPTSIYIETVDVPDLWVSKVEEDSNAYTYTNDEAIVSALTTNGYIQVGVYRLAQLETGKVAMTDYVKKTEYATSDNAGVFRPIVTFGLNVDQYGRGFIVAATTAEIEAGTQEYKPIVPKTVGRAVKKGLTANTETWTDEDKSKACETIGARSTKLYKHKLSGMDYSSGVDLNSLMIVSSRANSYTDMSEIKEDFALGKARITATISGGLSILNCTRIHSYGGFYFHENGKEVCVGLSGDMTIGTSTVTEI